MMSKPMTFLKFMEDVHKKTKDDVNRLSGVKRHMYQQWYNTYLEHWELMAKVRRD